MVDFRKSVVALLAAASVSGLLAGATAASEGVLELLEKAINRPRQ